MLRYSTDSPEMPAPRLMARSMLSFGTEVFLAFWTASTRVGLPARSAPPILAATSMFLMSLANDLARRASMTAFLCFVVAHLEWPDMRSILPAVRRPRRQPTSLRRVRRLRLVVRGLKALLARSLANGVPVVEPFAGFQYTTPGPASTGSTAESRDAAAWVSSSRVASSRQKITQGWRLASVSSNGKAS